jgi:hypothetical protein
MLDYFGSERLLNPRFVIDLKFSTIGLVILWTETVLFPTPTYMEDIKNQIWEKILSGGLHIM